MIVASLRHELRAAHRVAQDVEPLSQREGLERLPCRVAIERRAMRDAGQHADEARRRLGTELRAVLIRLADELDRRR